MATGNPPADQVPGNPPPTIQQQPLPGQVPNAAPPAQQPNQEQQVQIEYPWDKSEGNAWKIGDKKWYEGIKDPATLATMQEKDYQNPAILADAYRNLLALNKGSDNVVAVPGKEAKPEDWEKFYNKLGRPETADKYDFKFGEGIEVDKGLESFGKSLFHKLGATPERAQEAANAWNDFVVKQNADAVTQFKADNDAALAAIKTEWKGDWDTNITAGRKAISGLDLDAASLAAIEASVGVAPLAHLLARIGKMSAEGKFVGGGEGGGDNNPAIMTQEAAVSELNKLKADTKWWNEVYGDKNNPQHKEAVAKVVQLYALAGDKAPM